MINFKLLILSSIMLGSFSMANPVHDNGFDAKYINENSNMWPFDRYGKIFNVDVSSQRFDFLKNTVYDENETQKVIGRAWNSVHWSEATVFIRTEPLVNFTGIKTPMIARFKAINLEEAGKLSQGKDFTASAATVFFDVKNTDGIQLGEDEIVGSFTPDTPLSGILQIGEKSIKVSMNKRNANISTHKTVTEKQMNRGFWSAKITGVESDGKFVASLVNLTAIPDPRAGDDPALPRLLVIGDSVSMNYGPFAEEALKGIVNYHRNEGNCFSSNYGTQYADFWLGDFTKKGLQWDVIHFNHGLHDLKQAGPDAPFATPIETYKANLRRVIEILNKTGAKLVFCTTTPVPKTSSGKYGRQKGAEVAFNKAALEVISEYPEIQVNDLCKVVNASAVFDHFRKGGDVHYYKPAEQNLLGKTVADAVKKALEGSKK